MIIDFHAHMGRGPEGSDDLLQSNLPPELIIQQADEAGIDRTVVFPVTYPHDQYRRANEEIAGAVARYPDRLIGFARTSPGPNAIADVIIAVNELGLKGLKLHHGCDGFAIIGEPVHELLKVAGELKLPVIFHSIGVVEELIGLAIAHPETNIVFGHMAGFWNWPEMRRCIHIARKLPNVYLETSATMVSSVLKEACEGVPDKVLFGSDAPALHPKVELEKIKVLHLPPEIERKVLGENARQLLGF